MPGMYANGEYDLAGFAVGAVERERLLPRVTEIVPGDVVIGIASSGVHSNGFSLVRKIVELSGVSYNDICPFSKEKQTFGVELLTPTKIYVKTMLPLLKKRKVKACAHITGKCFIYIIIILTILLPYFKSIPFPQCATF